MDVNIYASNDTIIANTDIFKVNNLLDEEIMSARKKMHSDDIYVTDIYNRMTPLRCCTPWPWPSFTMSKCKWLFSFPADLSEVVLSGVWLCWVVRCRATLCGIVHGDAQWCWWCRLVSNSAAVGHAGRWEVVLCSWSAKRSMVGQHVFVHSTKYGK